MNKGSSAKVILIVEDEFDNREIMRMVVEDLLGYTAVSVSDGAAALLAISERIPDLILMDMSLPGINGWDATRIIKGSSETSAIPVVALTAHAMTSDREEAFAAGCNGFETKPIEMDKLLATIDGLLARKGGPNADA